MSYKKINSPITDLVGGSVILKMPINGAAYHKALTIHSIVFYDDDLNVVTPTTATFDIRCSLDDEDPTQYKALPFYSSNMEEGEHALHAIGNMGLLTGLNSGVSTMNKPVELLEVRIADVVGATKVKVKLTITISRG